MSIKAQSSFMKGGEFLLRQEEPDAVFCPEDFSEEQRMLRDSVANFLDQEVEPKKEVFDRIEGSELTPGLLEQMGEMGFLGIGVPEKYGGFEADFSTQLAFGEVAYPRWSFGLAIGVQTSLGVAPLLLYGNEDQKQKYLPGIVSAEIKSCYCLTEPSAGSDANSGKTQAIPSKDGSHYVLNGQKMWITGSGYADLFFVFAKIEDDKNLSCFIVEKAFGGIRLGAEEKKMGIKGSSTRQVFFEDVKVPAENLLGQRQEGFKIALNVLNTGRIKMSASVVGNAKRGFGLGVQYALEREQFGRSIAHFGAIKHKIGESAARIYAMESLAYRVGGQIDKMYAKMVADGMPELEAKYRSIAEYAAECGIAKVHNTEGEGYVIDEALQIHGGMGYSAETDIETLYRNVRINRIYEGTNEINRMLAVEMLLRKAMKGELALLTKSQEAVEEWKAGLLVRAYHDREFGEVAATALINLRKAILIIAGSASQVLQGKLQEEQEVLMAMADMLIQLFAAESAILRSLKHNDKQSELRMKLAYLSLHRAAGIIRTSGVEAVSAFSTGKQRVQLCKLVHELTHLPANNLVKLRRDVADVCLEEPGYPFNGK